MVGANGAGKSTLIKLLVGETLPDGLGSGCLEEGEEGEEGSHYKHHNLRVAYVAQHSFHHVEEHLERSPADYIAWRFGDGGQDRELLARVSMKLSSAEAAGRDGSIEELRSRRKAGRGLEYEVCCGRALVQPCARACACVCVCAFVRVEVVLHPSAAAWSARC